LPASKTSDPDAYVRGGYLVSRLPDGALLRFAGDAKPLRGLALPVHDTLWLGRLTRSADRSWTINDGLIAGRARTDQLLRSLRQAGLCESGGAGEFFDAIETYVHESADVLANGTSAPGQACDALSFGIAFRAAPITPGNARTTLEPLIECCEPGRSFEECTPRCGDGKVSGSEACDIAIAPGEAGACPTQCAPSKACATAMLEGTGCEVRCVEYPFQAVVPGDGCCPDGATSRVDPDCPPKCGNGVLEASETCDPPSSCASCVPEDKCLRATTTGSADTCDLVCNVTAINECRSEDGCCPARCTRGADNDCTTNCGNGRVDPGTTETCERDSPTPCARSCDDRNPCTTDIATGSIANCNVRCSHFAFGALGASDGCCPSGADANSDPDC
jgi:hypothetical protein